MTTSKHLYFVVCVDIEGLVPITRWCIDYHIGLEIKSVTMFSYAHSSFRRLQLLQSYAMFYRWPEKLHSEKCISDKNAEPLNTTYHIACLFFVLLRQLVQTFVDTK